MLNGTLPLDIRVLGFVEVPRTFNARFACAQRIYRYFIRSQKDYIPAEVLRLAKQFEGVKDFQKLRKKDRNKPDQSTIREIGKIQLIESQYYPTPGKDGLYIFCLEIVGNSFLWHQVRCMVGLLQAVLDKLLPESAILESMDPDFPKPTFQMADPEGLVLHDCTFEVSIKESRAGEIFKEDQHKFLQKAAVCSGLVSIEFSLS
eukprot:GHVP01021388.1.p1 GENE.GHVP01021388.1~~GHVP01021388.1.p1  ORF type:complete len:203 (+),score=38.77 GHVP01021388.1:377-985(+)